MFPLMKAVDHLESFIADCDRRTELAKKRLAETQEEISAEVAAKVSGKRFLTNVLMYYIHILTNTEYRTESLSVVIDARCKLFVVCCRQRRFMS